MSSISNWLHDFFSQIVCWFKSGLVEAFNAVVAAIAAVIGALASVLPNMPDFPTLPDPLPEILGWIAWVFPVHQAVLVLAFLVTAWLVWQAVAMAMRWARMLS